MALYRNLRPVRQAFKYDLVYRFLSKQASPAHLPLKPSFIPRNSCQGSNLTSTYSSTATFHHLAEHTLNSNIIYCMNIAKWMTTTAKSPNSYRKKVNYADILWPIEKILKEMKINRNDRIIAKSTDNNKLDGLDIKETFYPNSRWPAEKILKETKLVKKDSPKVPRREQKR